jgi:DDE superfamily endonuclease
MVLDGASSHKAKDLIIPVNIRLLALPPYAPELNPQEHVWDEVREKEFPNRVFNHLDAVIRQLEQGLPRLAAAAERLRSLTAWPWIVRLNLNATYKLHPTIATWFRNAVTSRLAHLAPKHRPSHWPNAPSTLCQIILTLSTPNNSESDIQIQT